MLISIIIINYNNSYNLKNCVESILNQRVTHEHELIIVDAGSKDDSLKLLEEYTNKENIKILQNSNSTIPYSPSKSRNIGIKNSNGDILVFTDSDCVVPRDWVENIMQSFNDYPDVCGVFGGKEPDYGKGLGSFYRRIYTVIYSRKFRMQKYSIISKNSIWRSSPFLLMASNNMAVKREIINRITLSEKFNNPAGEDVYFQLEIINNNGQLMFNPNINIKHYHPLNIFELIKKAWQQGESINRIKKYGFMDLTWKHTLKLKYFIKNIILIYLLINLFLFINISYYNKIIVVILLLIIFSIKRVNELRLRLKLISEHKSIEKKLFFKKINNFKLLLFDIIDFFVKGTRITSYLYYSYFKINIDEI